MDKVSMLKIVRDLEFDKRVSVFKKGNSEIELFRPSILSERFKDYNPKKNFQI